MPSTDLAPARVDGRRTDTRERIIANALRMFSERGYARTTIAEIERSVGLRPGGGGLYRHFRSKDDLLLEAARAYHDRVRALRASLASSGSARSLAGDLRHMVASLAEFLAGEGPIIRLSLETTDLPDAVRRTIADAWDDGYGMLVDLLVRHGLQASEATLVSVSMLGSLNHYFTQIGIWHKEPAGIRVDEFLAAWIEQVVLLARSFQNRRRP